MRGEKEGTGGERRSEGVERGEEWRKESFGSLNPFISALQKQKHRRSRTQGSHRKGKIKNELVIRTPTENKTPLTARVRIKAGILSGRNVPPSVRSSKVPQERALVPHCQHH